MDASQHAQTALAWLTVSDEEFAEGSRMQASEKIWGAAAHALTTVAMESGWAYGRHRDFIVTARRLIEESGDNTMHESFDKALQFHANFYQDFLDDNAIAENRPLVHQFVLTVLAFMDIRPDN